MRLRSIAALAASLPVAAGVYVVSQVFNKQVNQLSSAVYTIEGTWNDPEVNFDRSARASRAITASTISN